MRVGGERVRVEGKHVGRGREEGGYEGMREGGGRIRVVSCPDPALSRGKKGLVTSGRFLGLH